MKRTWAGIPAIACAAAMLSAPAEAPSQARPPIAVIRVSYAAKKAAVKPEGEAKARIEALDREIAEATRLGRTGEVRRLLAKGLTLLAGKEWDDTLEFSHSLVLRTEEVCVDSGKPHIFRIEQTYAPRVARTSPMSARAGLYRAVYLGGDLRAGDEVKDFGCIEVATRDFLDEPLRMETDLTDIPDGPYLLRVEFAMEGKPMASVVLQLELLQGLHRRLAEIAGGSDSVRGFDSLKPDILYPGDLVRKLNRGSVGLGSLNLARELEAAEATLASVKAGRDPFSGRTGDLKRHYLFEEAGEIMPCRIYVPAAYRGDRDFPLIVALHGLGGTEDAFFDSYGQLVPKLAEQHGYLVAAPLGYRVDGAYGAGLFRTAGDVAEARRSELSEKDVLRVLDLMKKHYRVDARRIYLLGHSMGAIGAWHLGAKYPGIWAALAPISGYGNPAAMERMKELPQIVVHGDADMTVPVAGSRAMVEAMKRHGVAHRYIEVPGGDHIRVVVPNLPAVFDFFNSHSRK